MNPSTNANILIFIGAGIALGLSVTWQAFMGPSEPSLGPVETFNAMTLADLMAIEPQVLNLLEHGFTRARQLQEFIANDRLALPPGTTLDQIKVKAVLGAFEEYLAQHTVQDQGVLAVVEMADSASAENPGTDGPRVHVRFHVVE